jgi:hypothetical protein
MSSRRLSLEGLSVATFQLGQQLHIQRHIVEIRVSAAQPAANEAGCKFAGIKQGLNALAR